MDSITHLTQKLLAERARQQNVAPPPYSAIKATEEDTDDSDDDEEEDAKPITLTINAGNSIHGSNNLVPTSSSPLADATKFSALLLHAITRINAANPSATGSSRQLKVDLTINCGLTIVGDRNVVGNVGVKPRQASAGVEPGTATQRVFAGAKRKPEDDEGEVEQPAAKVTRKVT